MTESSQNKLNSIASATENVARLSIFRFSTGNDHPFSVIPEKIESYARREYEGVAGSSMENRNLYSTWLFVRPVLIVP